MRKIKKVLITGIAGSGGSYLAEHIIKNHSKVKVHGVSRWHSNSSLRNLQEILGDIKVHECDLNDFGSIFSVLEMVKPDAIFHLASYANVQTAFITPITVMDNNIRGTITLLEAIRLAKIDPIVQICSTSEVYGQIDPKKVPVNEAYPIGPVNIYGVSKAAQDLLGQAYFKSYGMKVIITRMFTYINPRREDLFASSFAKQVARIEAGLQKVLLHGNLDSVRTIIDVRDAMEAYWVAVSECEFGEVYNIGGDKVISVEELLKVLKNKAKVEINSRLDKHLLRPTDVTLQIPDVSKFRKKTGWRPKYSFEESIEFLLDFWREEIQKNKHVDS